MAQEVFKNPNEQAKSIMKKKGNTFSFNGKKAWSGAVNSLDGVIEETHPYENAKEYDFHHSFYFSDPAIERIANGESLFFYVDDNGEIQLDPTNRGQKYDRNAIIEKIKSQIK